MLITIENATRHFDWEDETLSDILEDETLAGLRYFGVTFDGTTFNVPDGLDFTAAYDLLNAMEDCPDNNQQEEWLKQNPYYAWMTNENEYYLSGDDSFFDYGNSWVAEVLRCLEEEMKHA
jgi:hypothetical protein